MLQQAVFGFVHEVALGEVNVPVFAPSVRMLRAPILLKEGFRLHFGLGSQN
jgi:hypothetical protein